MGKKKDKSKIDKKMKKLKKAMKRASLGEKVERIGVSRQPPGIAVRLTAGSVAFGARHPNLSWSQTEGNSWAVGAQSSRLAEFGGRGMSFNICRGTLGSLAMSPR